MFESLRIGTMRLLGAFLLVCLGFAPAQATETVLHSFGQNYFSGAHPVGQLTLSGSTFYGVTQSGVNSFGDVFTMTTTGLVKVIHEFAPGGSDGVGPSSGLVAYKGNFYGTTAAGGTANLGVVYEITPTGTVTILHNFTGYNSTTPAGSDGSQPYAALLLASDGNLYGVTANGGSWNEGTVFTINPGGGGYSIIHNFNNTLDTAYNPDTALAESKTGVLYGASSRATGFSGGLYKLNKDGSGFTFIHGFLGPGQDPSGSSPSSDLVRAGDGNLYGYCAYGGANNAGTVYKVTPGASDTIAPLWAFDGTTGGFPNNSDSHAAQNRLLVGADHNLYGVTPEGGLHGYGTAFKLTLAGVCTRLTSFNTTDTYGTTNPLAQSGSSFYATSVYGGLTATPSGPLDYFDGGDGAAVSISSAGALKVIQSFYVRDVFSCYGNLVQVGTGAAAAFYGVTSGGGAHGCGAIFKIDSAGAFSIIHHLNNELGEGIGPIGSLLLGRDGFLYGTTSNNGGEFNQGTIFKVSTAGAFTVIHSFEGNGGEGAGPTCALVQGVGKDNNLYGACEVGGPSGGGTVFSVNTSGTKFAVLRYFNGPDGINPTCQLLPDGNGNLYGTTYSGGANNVGTIFKVSTAGATFTTLFNFYQNNSTGIYPAGRSPYDSGPMVLIGGMLYGVAESGGADGNGVIFQCDVSTGVTTALHSFDDSIGEGFNPVGGLIYSSSSGAFYGTTVYGGTLAGGGNGSGVIYAVNASSGALTVLHTFAGYDAANPAASDGSAPYGGIILGADGFLYGATTAGGASDDGILFQQTIVP